MYRKTALISGGTSGVGLSIVKELADIGYDVFFIGSDTRKGKNIEKQLAPQSFGTITFIPLDLSKPEEVNAFASAFVKKNNKLDLLANIAGVIYPNRTETTGGIEKTFAIGYLSAFILSQKLIPALQNGSAARIINVSANPKTILEPNISFDDLNYNKAYNGFKASINTIHAKTVLTSILSEQLRQQGIDVNCFHPGMVRSNLSRHMPMPLKLVAAILQAFMSKSAANGVYVCSAQDIQGVTGQLFVGKKPIPLQFSDDYKTQLWNYSHKMVNGILK